MSRVRFRLLAPCVSPAKDRLKGSPLSPECPNSFGLVGTWQHVSVQPFLPPCMGSALMPLSFKTQTMSSTVFWTGRFKALLTTSLRQALLSTPHGLRVCKHERFSLLAILAARLCGKDNDFLKSSHGPFATKVAQPQQLNPAACRSSPGS